MWRLSAVVLLGLLQLHEGNTQNELQDQIMQQVQNNLRGMENLGSQIAANVQRQLEPLQNLGSQINNQVQTSLMPVYAMAIRTNMANGVGGTTVVKYLGNTPRFFIIQNGVRKVCNGNVEGIQCSGSLEQFDVVNREDFCYSQSYASVNNHVCLSASDINVMAINGVVSCHSNHGSPVLVLSQQEYKELCGDRLRQVIYKYYSDPSDPMAIPIPNSNPYVTCLNNEPGICEFNGENVGGSRTIISSANQIHINNFSNN